MDFGARVMIPPGMFPPEYIEMRCFGRYEQYAVSAILFRIIEIASEQKGKHLSDTPAGQTLKKLLPKMISAVKSVKKWLKTASLHKAEIIKSLSDMSNAVIQRFSITPNDCTGFANLSLTGDFSLVYLWGEMNSKSSSVEIHLNQKNGILFVLYPDFTFASFIDLPCGHFGIKNSFYREFQFQAQHRAISCNDLGAFQILSECCRTDVKELVFCGCLSEGEKISTKPRKDMCKHHDEKYRFQACGCQLCSLCYFKHYLTANYDKTPCCSIQLSASFLLNLRYDFVTTLPNFQPILQRLKHDRRVTAFNYSSQACEKCLSTFMSIQRRDQLCPNCSIPSASISRRSSSAIRHRDSIKQIAKASEKETVESKGSAKQQGRRSKTPFRRSMNCDEFDKQEEGSDGFPVGQLPASAPEIVSYPTLRMHQPAASHTPSSTEESKAHIRSPTAKICKTCRFAFQETTNLLCENGCECFDCLSEAVVAGQFSSCQYCNSPISQSAIANIKQQRVKCHVCGIAVKKDEIEEKAECSVCILCVLIVKKSRIILRDKKRGTCRLCKKSQFKVDKRKYKVIRMELNFACCSKATMSAFPMKCGHSVCQTHKRTLQLCRKCNA